MTLLTSSAGLHYIRDASVNQVGWAVFAVSIATLGGAYFFQIGLGLAPCEMCLWQRPPYWIGMLVGLLAATAHYVRPLPRASARSLLGLGAVVFLVGAGIAFYHVGVEQKWWAGPAGCSGAAVLPDSFKDFQENFEDATVVRCDEIPWSFLGISLAGYNVLISLGLALVSGWGAFQAKEPR